MSRAEVKPYIDFVLPPSVITKIDVARLVKDAERIDNELTAASVRAKTGSSDTAHPVFSDQLTHFLELNDMNFDDTSARTNIVKQLRLLKDTVPVVHMTFAAAADPESLQKIIQWLRDTVNPQTVIIAGVQPALIAGVYMRTPNHVHDFSLRTKLASQRDLLRKELEAARG